MSSHLDDDYFERFYERPNTNASNRTTTKDTIFEGTSTVNDHNVCPDASAISLNNTKPPYVERFFDEESDKLLPVLESQLHAHAAATFDLPPTPMVS